MLRRNCLVWLPLEERNSKAPPFARRERWATLKILPSIKAVPPAASHWKVR